MKDFKSYSFNNSLNVGVLDLVFERFLLQLT